MPPADQRLTLQEAAERLGVHYMTAYRYVRTGRLAATRDGAQWFVQPRDVDQLKAAPQRARGQGRPRAASDLVHRMVAADEAGGWTLIEAALASGATPDEVLLDLLAPAMRAVGDGWAAGTLSVADEHRASAVATRLVGRLGPRFARRGRKRGTVVVGTVEGDDHGLPSAILSDLLRGEGYEVLDTGANTPAASFVDTARDANRLLAVAIGATSEDRDAALRRTVKLLQSSGVTAPVLVGGAAIRDEQHAVQLGADGWTGRDGRQALSAIGSLVV
jgi:excisionase family DNA binding protein